MKPSVAERAARRAARVRQQLLGRWSAARGAQHKPVPPPPGARLRKRVAELEEEVQELRRLHFRVAELTDLVQELLVPAATRDEERLRELLDKYDAGH